MKTKTLRRPSLAFVVGACLLAFSATALAVTAVSSKFKGRYSVRAEILIGGKIVSRPQFKVLSDEAASMHVHDDQTESDLRMTLQVSESPRPELAEGIALKMTVAYQDRDHDVRAEPRLVVAPGEKGLVVLGSDGGETLEMKIKAERM